MKIKIKSFLELAGIVFCYGKGKRAIISPIIFSPWGEVSNFCFPFKKSERNKMIIFNSGLLAGYRNTNGSFNNRGTNANIWSSLESGTNAWRRNLNSGNATVNRNANNKLYGFSIRCIKRWFTLLNSCKANLTGFNLRTKYEF